MTDVIVVGDGPGGLSAALFLAKNDQDVVVFGNDETAMHYAMLYNYLGIPEITGSDFQEVARKQVKGFGAEIQDQQVTGVEKTDDGFAVTLENGERAQSKYLVVAEGKGLDLVKDLGLVHTDEGAEVDQNYRTSIDKLYVIGRSTRINRSQAIISAGSGAVAALDILSRIKGKNFYDFDTVKD